MTGSILHDYFPANKIVGFDENATEYRQQNSSFVHRIELLDWLLALGTKEEAIVYCTHLASRSCSIHAIAASQKTFSDAWAMSSRRSRQTTSSRDNSKKAAVRVTWRGGQLVSVSVFSCVQSRI